MTTTSLTRRNVSGSSAAAKARLVSGPTATRVTESGSLSRSARRISLYAGSLDGVNAWPSEPGQSSTGLIPSPSSSLAKRCTHALSAVRCGCYLEVSIYYLFQDHNKSPVSCGAPHTVAWIPPSPSIPSAGISVNGIYSMVEKYIRK